MQVDIREGSILEADTEAIVAPANSEGRMAGGLAAVIRKAAGDQVEAEAMAQAPIPLGSAVLTSAGAMACRGIIHVATLEPGAAGVRPGIAGEATRAALAKAIEAGIKSLALPGLGTGSGGVHPEAAAREMFAVLEEFQDSKLERVLLTDVNSEVVTAWTACLDRA